MPRPIGDVFAPTFENSELARGRGGAGQQPQEALQVLSYRLPRVRGSGSLSPLQGQDRAGGPNMSVLESVFKTILGPEAAAAFLSGGMGAGMPGSRTPDPVVRPGVGAPQGFPTGGAPAPFDFRDWLSQHNTGVTGGRGPVNPAQGNPFQDAY
jgi:hypothetical protein